MAGASWSRTPHGHRRARPPRPPGSSRVRWTDRWPQRVDRRARRTPPPSTPTAEMTAPATVPRQPACTAATACPSLSATSTGTQSATWTASATDGSSVTTASAVGRPAAASDILGGAHGRRRHAPGQVGRDDRDRTPQASARASQPAEVSSFVPASERSRVVNQASAIGARARGTKHPSERSVYP